MRPAGTRPLIALARVAGPLFVLLFAHDRVAPAHAQFSTLPVSKCGAQKLKATAKGTAGVLGCYGKHAASPDAPTLAACLAKQAARFDNPIPGRGPFDKADLKNAGCLTTGDQDAYGLQIPAAAARLNALLMAGSTPSPCDAARVKCLGKYIAGRLRCVAKAAGKSGGTVDPTCLGKLTTKFTTVGGRGCYDKATDACSSASTAAAALADADGFVSGVACNLLPGSTPCAAICHNGFVESGESCDPPGIAAGSCSSEFSCTDCACACPTRLQLTPDAADPDTVLDVGWNGVGHRQALVTNGDLTVGLSCPASTRPCGTCTVTGPVPNGDAGAGRLDNRRCTNDTAIKCADDVPCLGGGGTCAFFLPLHPHAWGHRGFCSTSYVEGASGTVNVESGEMSITLSTMWTDIDFGDPMDACPRCVGDPTPNDGIAAGACELSTNAGAACDANGVVPGVSHWDAVSLDCPQYPVPLEFYSARRRYVLSTDPTVKTLTADSPDCDDGKCLCGICNNDAEEGCETDAECPDPPGPMEAQCGGGRCLGGPNADASCNAQSECPGGGFCGTMTSTNHSYNYCSDTTALPGGGALCVDTAPLGDSVGECQYSYPFVHTCSNDPVQTCEYDWHCGDPPAQCLLRPIRCFTDSGMIGNSIGAPGQEDVPVGDAARPLLGSVTCAGGAKNYMLSNTLGLRGPARLTMRADVVLRP